VGAEIMLQKQKRLFTRLIKDFYTRKEIMDTLDMPYEETIELTKDIKRTEKGFNKIDIVIALMGGVLYAS